MQSYTNLNCSATVIDGQPFEVGGLNIWSHQWVDLRERFTAKELLYNQTLSVNVYEISNGVKSVRFGATEVSNCVWKIYTAYDDAKSITQTFTINESLISNLLKRFAKRIAVTYTISLLLVIVPNVAFPNPNETLTTMIIVVCSVITVMGFTMMFAYKRMRKMYSGFQITLDDNGIELKAPMAAYKRIAWSEATYVEKDNGDIKVYNKTVSAINRWWYGTGVILSPREINDRGQLLLSLNSHINKYELTQNNARLS